jgi:hypothetical protein
MGQDVESAFSSRVKEALEECRRLGYHPHYFEDMLATFGAVRLAEKLVTSADIQSGLITLGQMGRLDLAIESIMLEAEFNDLFRASFLDAARWHLQEARKGTASIKKKRK